MNTQIANARISKTMLGFEDHGIFTCYVFVDGEGWGCGFGGYALDVWNKERKSGRGEREGTAYGAQFIVSILRTLEIDSWEKLPGTPVRVETEGIGGRILRIGHYLKNRWFDPKELAAYEAVSA